MADKKKKQKNNISHPVAVPESKRSRPGAAKLFFGSWEFTPYQHLGIMAGIAILTWLFLSSCLNNQFVWDDQPYVLDNLLIRHLSWSGLKAIFSTPVMGNYQPLTILTYAIEYHFANLDPQLYHFDSLLIHIINSLLAYWLVLLAVKKPVAAIAASVLFALHPMHVESVAWVSSRKDVLYSFFFLAACVSHILYLRSEGKRKWLWYSGGLILFVLSLLSKPLAVTLPLTLLLIDYLENRKWAKSVIIEKLPHFILATLFGVISIKIQKLAGAIDIQREHYNFLERIALGGYAFLTYLWKAIVPVELCNFYAYPARVNGSLPAYFYICPFLCVGLLILAWKYLRRNRLFVAGALFFIFNITLVLQLIPVGEAIVADRYSYIPYIGLFLIAGASLSSCLAGGATKPGKYLVIGIAGAYCLILFFQSNARTKVWYDSMSLWTDAIRKDPVGIPGAYDNIGYLYYQKWAAANNPYEKRKDYDSALYFMNKTIELWPTFDNPYMIIGDMQSAAGKYDEAKQNYLRALSLNSKNPGVSLGLARLYYTTKNYDSSGYWFRAAANTYPSPQTIGSYANFLNLTGKPDSAIVEFGKAINIAPRMFENYLNRAIVYKQRKAYDAAIHDFDAALKLSPETGMIYYERSLCYYEMGDKISAVRDLDKAISLGYTQVDRSYYDVMKK